MDESATQCHAIVMDNATLKRQVADLSVIQEVTGSTSTGSYMTMSDLLQLQEEEVMRQEKMNTMERKLHFLFLVLHVTHMDQNMCRMEADDAEDDVLFLYYKGWSEFCDY